MRRMYVCMCVCSDILRVPQLVRALG